MMKAAKAATTPAKEALKAMAEAPLVSLGLLPDVVPEVVLTLTTLPLESLNGEHVSYNYSGAKRETG